MLSHLTSTYRDEEAVVPLVDAEAGNAAWHLRGNTLAGRLSVGVPHVDVLHIPRSKEMAWRRKEETLIFGL